MKYFLVSALLLIPNTLLANDKEDIELAMEFARMKFRSDYPNDLTKASKPGQLFILWVDDYNPKLFAQLKAEHPDAIHSFCASSKLEGVSPGIVIGCRGQTVVEQVRVINSVNPIELNSKGVILTTAPNRPLQDNPRFYPRYTSYPSGCPGGFSSGFR